MNKQEQWKLAAIIIAQVDRHHPAERQFYRDERAIRALRAICPDYGLDYEWVDVVRSHRNRSAAAQAKRRAIA